MLDSDLAALYEVPTRALNQAISRNSHRFPERFMFQLLKKEASAPRSQIVPLEVGVAGILTEHGVVMLSAVLNSGPRGRDKGSGANRKSLRLRQTIRLTERL